MTLSKALALAGAFLPLPALAQPIVLDWPVDCELGTTCYIEDYVDTDPAHGRQSDYACGIKSRDGHKGTDIALLSFETQTTVRAAANAVVLRVRDGMVDDPKMPNVTDDNACGNAVFLDHGQGWRTLYCHLKQGSLSVAPGDTVSAGDPLGQIGLSGKTTHPHLHLSVYHNGALVDPFRPNATASCGEEQEMLWAEPSAYDRASLITAGFTDAIPSLPQVTTGKARRHTLRPDQPIVLYGHAGHAEHGDVLTLSATGPDGEVFQRKILLKHPQVSQMQAFGRKPPAEGWEPGEYLGRAQLTRGGRVIAHRFAHVMIE
jgi:hypothetical protein